MQVLSTSNRIFSEEVSMNMQDRTLRRFPINDRLGIIVISVHRGFSDADRVFYDSCPAAVLSRADRRNQPH